MSKSNIWYVEFPTFQYEEDVLSLAKENKLKIVDARFDAGDGAKDVPELTVKKEASTVNIDEALAGISADDLKSDGEPKKAALVAAIKGTGVPYDEALVAWRTLNPQ